jgi:hypothetical protein
MIVLISKDGEVTTGKLLDVDRQKDIGSVVVIEDTDCNGNKTQIAGILLDILEN